MAGIDNKNTGTIAKIYWVATPLTDHTLTSVTDAMTAANLVKDVTDISEISQEVEIVRFPLYGSEYGGALPSQKSVADMTFTVIEDMGDTIHKALFSADNKQPISVIVAYEDGVKGSYASFNGYKGTVSRSQGPNDAIKLAVTVAVDGALYLNEKA